MNVDYDNSFTRDIKKLKDKEISAQLKKSIEEMKPVQNITQLKNVRKMSGDHALYRLKIKNYRLGFECIGNDITLLRFMHRRDIYKWFPK